MGRQNRFDDYEEGEQDNRPRVDKPWRKQERPIPVDMDKSRSVGHAMHEVAKERGARSENQAEDALHLLQAAGDIFDFRRATQEEDLYEKTDFWVKMTDGNWIRLQVKSSTFRLVNEGSKPEYKGIYFLVVPSGSRPQQVVQYFREHVLEFYRRERVHPVYIPQPRPSAE